MKKLVLITILGLAAACGGGDVGKLKKLSDEACACKDKACADKVNKEMDEVINGMKKEPSESEAKTLMESMAKAGECIAKLGGGTSK